MAKTNVSKGDLRSLKRVYDKAHNKSAKKRAKLMSHGICYYCRTAWVKGRKVCISCSKRQVTNTAFWGFRKVLREYGIDNPTDALETLSLAKGEDNVAVITALMNAIEASEYKSDVG